MPRHKYLTTWSPLLAFFSVKLNFLKMALYGHFNAITSWEYSANMGPNKTRPLAVVAGSRNLAFAFFDMSVRTYSQFFIESSSPPAPAGWPLGGFNIWQPQWVGGGGSPKSRWKEQNQLICDIVTRGRGSTNPKMLRTYYIEASLLRKRRFREMEIVRRAAKKSSKDSQVISAVSGFKSKVLLL